MPPFWIAESESRIVLTLDKDFWQIAVQRRTPLKQSGVVLFRAHPATSAHLDPLVRAFVEGNRAWTGHISIISVDGIQMLSAPGGSNAARRSGPVLRHDSLFQRERRQAPVIVIENHRRS
jgi:hypothetical protein